MRRILVTNDDGINADGIVRLARAAKDFGEVWVIAPAEQCSAMSHRITLRSTIDVFPADFPVEGVHAFKTTGTPADCIRFGVQNFMDNHTDIVLSGINFGYNCGFDLQYSATAGAALEASCMGIQAIALSEGIGSSHEVTDRYLKEVLEELMEQPLPKNQVWNVNFPDCSLNELKGILRGRTVDENSFYDDTYSEEPLPGGGIRLTVNGRYHENANEATDFRAILDKYISIGILHNLS
ncbi:MAG: 5'/3'-nucleotidase SurE [Parasporobacterium sp.]|nr:5'/3'-nucleotidase SurE [Parasporobacterium sp.]